MGQAKLLNTQIYFRAIRDYTLSDFVAFFFRAETDAVGFAALSVRITVFFGFTAAFFVVVLFAAVVFRGARFFTGAYSRYSTDRGASVIEMHCSKPCIEIGRVSNFFSVMPLPP